MRQLPSLVRNVFQTKGVHLTCPRHAVRGQQARERISILPFAEFELRKRLIFSEWFVIRRLRQACSHRAREGISAAGNTQTCCPSGKAMIACGMDLYRSHATEMSYMEKRLYAYHHRPARSPQRDRQSICAYEAATRE